MPITRHLILFLGAVGTLICAAASLGVWYVELRLDRAQERVFKRADQSLEGINRRLVETQKLAAQSKITVEEIRQRMQDWTKKEASERLATKLGVDEKVQQLASGLHQAELILELSQDTVEHVRQVLDAGADLGIGLNADTIGPLLERIENIKEDLNEAIDTAEGLLHIVDGSGDAMEKPLEQVSKIAARLLATFGKIDSRLISFRDRLANAQDSIRALSAKTHSRILLAAVCVTLFLLWMAAGQICLCRRARTC
jgi:hypothetical protein